jgi:D-psicose/D-tagatose/L-ribulose 3-epimerase
MMRFGASTFIWESPFSTGQHLGLLAKVRGMGFEVLEVAVEDPSVIDVRLLQRAASDQGLGVITCGVFGPERNLSSLEPAERQASADYLRWMIDAAAELGSPVVGGPMYSAVGKPRLAEPELREKEWALAVEGLQNACEYAAQAGVRLAFEPLNRFENDLVNVVEQGWKLIRDVGAENLGFHLDTFHMHLEEKDSAQAVRRVGERLFHLHACENDRGVPGTGQVAWGPVFSAVQEIGYGGDVVIESFTPQVQSIARAVNIWRKIAPDQDTLARDGLSFIHKQLGVSL